MPSVPYKVCVCFYLVLKHHTSTLTMKVTLFVKPVLLRFQICLHMQCSYLDLKIMLLNCCQGPNIIQFSFLMNTLIVYIQTRLNCLLFSRKSHFSCTPQQINIIIPSERLVLRIRRFYLQTTYSKKTFKNEIGF